MTARVELLIYQRVYPNFSAKHFTPPPGLCVLTISQGPQDLLRSEASPSPVNGSYGCMETVWMERLVNYDGYYHTWSRTQLPIRFISFFFRLSFFKVLTLTPGHHHLLKQRVCERLPELSKAERLPFFKIQPTEISDLFWFLNMDWFPAWILATWIFWVLFLG
jgi:hypothetical protein